MTPELREFCINIIKIAKENGCRKKIACEDCGISIKTVERWEINLIDKRHGPKNGPSNKLSKEERQLIIKVATSSEYMDMSPWLIVPTLADKEGIYIGSESSFYRILNEEKLLAHRGKSKIKKNERPKSLIAHGPNEIWTWDITYMKGPIKGQFYYLYMFMDVFSRKIVGYKVHESESMEFSAVLISEIYKNENVEPGQVTLHSDNGGPMKGSTMLATLQLLGVIPSFSRPLVSNDNPFSESLFKTFKYRPEYPDNGFISLEDAREWCDKFVDWYNNEHLHSGIKFVTPSSRHEGNDKNILQLRKKVYIEAKNKNPNRWSKEIRNWDWIGEVSLNHFRGKDKIELKNVS